MTQLLYQQLVPFSIKSPFQAFQKMGKVNMPFFIFRMTNVSVCVCVCVCVCVVKERGSACRHFKHIL